VSDRVRTCHLFLSAVLLLAALAPAPAAAEEIDTWTPLVEQRKDVLVARLAVCESHGAAQPDRGFYVGRYQFSTRTVINYVRERDGRTLTVAEARALAQDEAQASELAKYVIFDRDGHRNWPACSRKLGIARQVGEIKRR
jgi:hypothetical protein